ncbi:MAG: hypothetical protein RJB09_130 [Pseudomonadota bacterium]
MIKTIRSQAIRLAGLYALLAGLVVWQRDFIISGILAHVQLNLVIIGVFLFGSVMTARNLLNLRNDVLAYSALRTVFEDVQDRQFETMTGAQMRQRCLTPGLVFRSSALLGPVFDLTLEELLRSKQMRISVATMQNMTNAIDGRISHYKALTTYLSSMCIFLGLIGTFIGLMEMVASVGGIIGGLANTDASSSDTMRSLIKNLEAPLTGMASGFSASLFGLTGSLMLSIGGRFVSVATHSIREEFEQWLAGISQFEGERAMEGGSGATLLGSLLQRVGTALRANTERLEQQIDVVERASRQLDRAARTEQQAIVALSRVEHLQVEVSRLRADHLASTNTLNFGLLDGFERLSRSAQEQTTLAMTELTRLAAHQSRAGATLSQVATLSEQMARTAMDHHGILRSDLAHVVAGQEQAAASLAQVQANVQRTADSNDQLHAASSAEIAKLAMAQTDVEATLQNLGSLNSQAIRSNADARDATLAEIAKLVASQVQTRAALSELFDAQAHAAQSKDERQQAALDEIARLASVQDQANSLLIRIAATQAAQPEQGTVTAVITQTVSGAVAQMAQAMDQSVRALTHEITRLAEEQQRTTAAVTQTPEDLFKREIGDLSRSLQSGINAGLLDVAQTLETTLASQTEALRDLASVQIDAAAAKPNRAS